MANETSKRWCIGCGHFHNANDCPWKFPVSGIYEHNAPHIVAPDLSNRHYHSAVHGGTTGPAHGPSVDMAKPKDTPVNPWDNQVGGQHYKKGIQPFEYAMANNLNSLEFSVVKYLRKKGDKADRIKDLKKAKDCLEKLIWWEEHDGKI